MYQIQCECGYQIQVIGKGEKGMCQIVKSPYPDAVYTGTYDECVKWLMDRAVRVVGKPETEEG